MSKEEVVLLDFWASPFCGRVKIALAEKGVEYEHREEDVLGSKSELLLNSNPIHKKVPVLLHNGKPVCESTVIVNYIDEAWPSPPLLPTCPYERARARFWGDFIDKKIFEGGAKIWGSKGEALEVGKKDFIEILKQLEGTLGEKDFFCGDNFGFVDILLIPLTTWFYAYEKFGGFKVEDECPKFSVWVKRCMQRESVAKALPEPEKVYEAVVMLRKMNGIE
ncbi:probable glutathione S-transferase parC [Vitis riparia]|uniref:probable glutathione S-transferase parC n=1 Tax=Vitis riparia TaxID=96939 RepID=UPI00155B1945|nr:probable glutathione S-transferase parC [Vitis riparia]